MNKGKLIKKYIGNTVINKGFEYQGYSVGQWIFTKKKDRIEEKIIIEQDRWNKNKIKLVLFTGISGWGYQEIRDFIEGYKQKEYWTFKTEEEYIQILEFFSDILRTRGLIHLEKMCSHKPGEFPIEEMSRKLYYNYNKLLEESKKKWGQLETKKIKEILYTNREKSLEKVEELMLELSVQYTEIILREQGGELIMVGHQFALGKIGKENRILYPLLIITTSWKQYHENIPIEHNILN